MPAWVNDCCSDYIKRMPSEFGLRLIEVAAEKRSKSQSLEATRQRETARLLEAVPKGSFIVALDERGSAPTTKALAQKLQQWQMDGRDISLLIGGPDGIDFSQPLSAKTGSNSGGGGGGKAWPDWRLSLSALTLPHPMVRVLLVEQLYRAWSLGAGHPYHRE